MKVKRDDGSEIDVEWGVEEHGEPGNGWDDPGTGPIVYLTAATSPDGMVDLLADLSDVERDRIEQECAVAQDESDRYDSGPDD